MDQPNTKQKGTVIKNIYLYLVSFVALMMMIFSTADIINIGLRTYVFPKADRNPWSYPCVRPEPISGTSTGKEALECSEEQKKQEEENRIVEKQRNLVRDISFILVAIPVFAYHWRIIRKREEA